MPLSGHFGYHIYSYLPVTYCSYSPHFMIVEIVTKRKSFARGHMAASGTGQMTSLVLSASYPHAHPTKVLLILGSLSQSITYYHTKTAAPAERRHWHFV